MILPFDPLKYSYASRRRVMYAKNGMVCTSQPLAAQAGLAILRQGGNAADAAVAAAACLTVVEPSCNGIGGDAFALIWIEKEKKLYGLNGSGPAPMLLDVSAIREKYGAMPKYGWIPVTVPGIPSAWATLSGRYGKLPFEDLMKPAIRYAEEGYPLSPVISERWGRAYREFEKNCREESQEYWFRTFAPKGRAYRAGEIVTLPDHGKTLAEIGRTKAESFYRGALAEKIDAWSRKTGGYLRKEDLAAYHAETVTPIETNYRGYTVSEIPPNGHGVVALMALNILEGFEFHTRDTAETIHRQIESMKLAFVDGQRYVTDPRHMKVTVDQLLSRQYAAERRRLIGEEAVDPVCGDPACGGTVYLCAADGEGNMISYIQSNYMGFGSAVVIPETGIAMQNRGANFYLDPASENCAAPGKKPYHTIIPGFLLKDGEAVGPFGVMGGFMQPQGHLQMVTNLVDFHMNPQESLDAPRWQWVGGKNIEVERDFPPVLTEQLMRMGHIVKVVPDGRTMGCGQIIWKNEEGVLAGGSEPRTDGIAAAY